MNQNDDYSEPKTKGFYNDMKQAPKVPKFRKQAEYGQKKRIKP